MSGLGVIYVSLFHIEAAGYMKCIFGLEMDERFDRTEENQSIQLYSILLIGK